MEPDLQVSIKGVPEELALGIRDAMSAAVRAFAKADPPLDFRRMHRIIVAADYAAELAELSKATTSGNPVTYTNEDYAIGVAKILLLPRGNEIEIVPVIGAHVVAPLVGDDPSHYESRDFRLALHLLHHELCHVHDENKKIDAFPEVIIKKAYEGKESYIHPLAYNCWSEYIANRLSYSTAETGHATDMAVSLANAIPRTKQFINQEIKEYRTHADLNRLLGVFERHAHYLPKTAAYVLGYIDGLGIPLNEISKEAEGALRGSYFETTWDAMRRSIREMYAAYPDGWKDMSVYDPLSAALEEYFADMGLFFENRPGGEVYVEVPYRPETMPGLDP